MLLAAAVLALASPPLWEIGTRDGDDREFALAPGGYRSYREDPVYIVGRSSAKDLPYVHPGPIDGWAGGRRHVFTFVFAARGGQGKGCKLVLDLVDAQDSWPASLFVSLNGAHRRLDCAPGAGDASVFGAPEKGRPQHLEVAFPAGALRDGVNVLHLDNDRYSWLLYDHLAFEAAGASLAPVDRPVLLDSPTAPPLLDRAAKGFRQAVDVDVLEPESGGTAILQVDDGPSQPLPLRPGINHLRRWINAVGRIKPVRLRLSKNGDMVADQTVEVKPVPRWTVYLIPHTHVDIGYTETQPQVERKQWRSLAQALDLIDKTAGYPDASKFRWQIEGLWPVESWLKQASKSDRERFFRGVAQGRIGLNAIFANELTGLCTEPELDRWAGYGRKLFGQVADSAIISDVPGYAWGVVSALRRSGVKYFSFGMNDSARLGTALSAWGDRPFYWRSPDGDGRVLCWSAGKGYPWFHRMDVSRNWTPALFEYLGELDRAKLPYHMVHIPYTKGDNGPPDPALPAFVRQWNSEHAYPRLVIATVSQSMQALEQEYGRVIPTVAGDFTPYWEDGAASSARETAMTRNASNRLIQAEALWKMARRRPGAAFDEAWRQVLLFNEHTWGAYNSVSAPEDAGVLEQWRIKAGFAKEAQLQSSALLNLALPRGVSNTLPWPRREWVALAVNPGTGAQKLRDGGYAAIVQAPASASVPLLPLPRKGRVTVGADWIDNGRVRIQVDRSTGAIKGLRWNGHEFAGEGGLNRYLYVRGTEPRSAAGAAKVQIEPGELGPLVGSLLVRSEAPGCRSLVREVRLIADSDRVELADTIDKLRVLDKEGVHIAFPFRVPGGTMRLNVPGAVIRPEIDQIPGACKNWFSVERWADVSNSRFGISFASVDAPLVEVGGITAETPWIEHLKPTQTLVSYVMNNYWFTNYRAYQEGPVTFRYMLLPHGPYSERSAQRFGIAAFQPLLVPYIELSL